MSLSDGGIVSTQDAIRLLATRGLTIESLWFCPARGVGRMQPLGRGSPMMAGLSRAGSCCTPPSALGE